MLGTPNRDRRAEYRSETRRDILAAAWEIARAEGLAAITLRAVAARVGMQAPSLYTHFDSKNAIYDAMFEQGWADYIEAMEAVYARLPAEPRDALKLVAATFFDFSVSDPARYHLTNRQSVPGFRPSAAAYAPAVRALALGREYLGGIGVTDEAGVDLFTALVGGLIDQQLANEPGGNRWRRLLDRVIDMYADEMGLPRVAGAQSRTRSGT